MMTPAPLDQVESAPVAKADEKYQQQVELLWVELQKCSSKRHFNEREPYFKMLSGNLSPSLSSYLERMVGDTATAEDLLQESLIKISKGLATFEGKSSLKTWAYTITTRVAIDYFRRSDQRRNIVELGEVQEPWDLHEDISEAFIVDEMNACIREVIDSLPEDYRAALVLHDLEGLTAQETADICGTSTRHDQGPYSSRP